MLAQGWYSDISLLVCSALNVIYAAWWWGRVYILTSQGLKFWRSCERDVLETIAYLEGIDFGWQRGSLEWGYGYTQKKKNKNNPIVVQGNLNVVGYVSHILRPEAIPFTQRHSASFLPFWCTTMHGLMDIACIAQQLFLCQRVALAGLLARYETNWAYLWGWHYCFQQNNSHKRSNLKLCPEQQYRLVVISDGSSTGCTGYLHCLNGSITLRVWSESETVKSSALCELEWVLWANV